MFQCCATFEIGFTYIVPIFGLAWLYTDKARDALRLSIPVLLGECVTLAFNMGARLVNTLRETGVLAADPRSAAYPRTLTCRRCCAPGPCRCRRASRSTHCSQARSAPARSTRGCPLRRHGGRCCGGGAGCAGRAAKPQAKPAAVFDRPCHAVRTVAADRAFAQIPAGGSEWIGGTATSRRRWRASALA